MARLRFHQATFDLLQLAPLPSESNRRLLEVEASAAGLSLPAAAVEWLSLENGISLLNRPGSTGEALSIKKLTASIQSLHGIRKPRLVFLREKQGHRVWAFDLVQEANPPVLVRLLDTDGRESWRTAADRFSDFVFGWIWDHPSGGYTARAQLNCSLKQIRRLTAGLVEHPTGRAWPSHKTFRLQKGQARIRIHYQPEAWSDVVIWSPDLGDLRATIAHASNSGLSRKAFFSSQPAVGRLLTE